MPEIDIEIAGRSIDADRADLARPVPRGSGRGRGRFGRGPDPGPDAQGVADELAARAAQEGRPLELLLRQCTGRSSTWPKGPSPGSTAASTTRPASPVAIKVLRQPVRLDPRGRDAVPQGGRGRHAAPPPQHRPGHRSGAAGQPPLHDHGVRRGDEPPRVPQAARPAQGQGGLAADARPGPRPAVLARAGRDPPRPEGDQHPDLQLGRGQARRFRSGHDRGGRARHGDHQPAHRRLLGAGADLRQPQGRPSVRHLLPGLRLLPHADRPGPARGFREQGPAQEDAQARLRRHQADQRAPPRPGRAAGADHREDDEDGPEGPLPDHGRGGRRPRGLSGHRRSGRGRGQRTTPGSTDRTPARSRRRRTSSSS